MAILTSCLCIKVLAFDKQVLHNIISMAILTSYLYSKQYCNIVLKLVSIERVIIEHISIGNLSLVGQ